jgi:2-oxo-3-hexenedioate decarboxylase
MALDAKKLEKLAARVDDAALENQAITKLTAEFPELDFEDAYKIQRLSMARRHERGDVLVGMKMGLTSVAKMKQVGVHQPIYGHLTETMMLSDGESISRAEHIHPRAEPELAFLISDHLRGPVTPAQAMLYVEGVCAAIEVIDSRFENFEFKLPDVVADNASSSRFVLGSKMVRPEELDIGNLGVVFEVNGEVKQVGSTAAIYEHPARSLAALANMLAEHDEEIEAGSIVLAGAATAAEFVHPGDHVCLRMDGLGEVRLFVVE